MERFQYHFNGIVQGVGFRPFVYKLALKYQLFGFVQNNSKGITLEVEGKKSSLEKFEKELLESPPYLVNITSYKKSKLSLKYSNSFIIQDTNNQNDTITASLLPDIAVCDKCIDDIKSNTQYKNYFATNCTNCGPRYSIIQAIPYDRDNTSMDKFKMCPNCLDQYSNPLDRRYHAQPISCNECGPQLTLFNNQKKIQTENIYKKIVTLIQSENIIAIKGIGGFHIICDATNDNLIDKLRAYKNRPTKPFAIMCKSINQIKTIANVSHKEELLLLSKEAPIVILDKKESNQISKNVAPNIDKIGCFVPYTSLYHLLFEYLKTPLIVTSANLQGESILSTKKEIELKLPFCEYIVDYNREIVNPVEDSVVQVINNQTSILRLSRGYAPKTLKLPFKLTKKLLAVGANSKSTIAIGFEDTIIISPYIGDLDSIENFNFFEHTIHRLKSFYRFEPDIIIHDLHPSYESTKWAKSQSVKLVGVQHHLAHIYSLKAEYNLKKQPYLGFSFDGTGYGLDGKLWGGEVFINDKRIYRFKSIKLLGAIKAIKEPRRLALALLFEKYTLDKILQLDIPTIKAFTESEIKLLYQSYKKNINTFETSSVGRVFDAVASLANLVQITSYEGESGLLIESHYDKNIHKQFSYTFKNGVIDIDIVTSIMENNYTAIELSSMLINTIENIILDISNQYNTDILLTGGVFQNKTLLGNVSNSLEKYSKRYYIHNQFPSNDSGISLGQIYKTALELNSSKI